MFDFWYGDEVNGESWIDAQYLTSSEYESTVMNGSECTFGINFANGRVQCYPIQTTRFFAFYVRGEEGYGNNDFDNKNNGVVNDKSTGLDWMQQDSGMPMSWQEAL